MTNLPKRKKRDSHGAPDWLLTYGDMVTLLLVFFVTMFSLQDIVEPVEVKLVMANYTGMGLLDGGNTLDGKGQLPELGTMVSDSLSPSDGENISQELDQMGLIFQDQISNEVVRLQRAERGLVVSLAADVFFDPASADVKIEENRELLKKLALFLSSPSMEGRFFRIEGHTDAVNVDINGPYKSNWELSAMRSINILYYLFDYSQKDRSTFEKQFQIAGYSDTSPILSNSTAEGRAFNRRIDVIILKDGHLPIPETLEFVVGE